MKGLRLAATGSLTTLFLLLVLTPAFVQASTTAYSCRATVVAVHPAARTITVKLRSGSATIMALRGRDVTITLSAKAAFSDASHEVSPLTLRRLVRGAVVSLSGTVTRAHGVARAVATRVVLRRLPNGTLLWSDDFSGPAGAAPGEPWYADTGTANSDEAETLSASNVALDGSGHLVIVARRTDAGYTSAEIETGAKPFWQYGRMVARIELPAGCGLWPAFWALGTDYDSAGYPRCGEIDMMENLGQNVRVAYGSIHGPETASSDTFGITTAKTAASSLSSGYHLFGVNRAKNLVQITLDGVPYATYRPSTLSKGEQWVFNKPFYVLLNLAVGASGSWPGTPSASTTFPARMHVDWVRLYAWSPAS
ncbi:MAG TPA: glycoside hydrolase family 16 protein [Thermoleophilia bacterium]|nr:glycoside hydrolase family 16 protein [Thermoleophilia bacterium]